MRGINGDMKAASLLQPLQNLDTSGFILGNSNHSCNYPNAPKMLSLIHIAFNVGNVDKCPGFHFTKLTVSVGTSCQKLWLTNIQYQNKNQRFVQWQHISDALIQTIKPLTGKTNLYTIITIHLLIRGKREKEKFNASEISQWCFYNTLKKNKKNMHLAFNMVWLYSRYWPNAKKKYKK